MSEQEFAQVKARLLNTQARGAVDAQADRRTSIS
jgi:hypothetical protein